MKLYYARHGQTNSNASVVTTQTATVPDEPLTEIGVQQANELANQLKDVPFDAIISSPLKRAMETAEVVNKYHKLPIEVIDDLQERKAPIFIDMNTWNDLFDFDKNISIENVELLPDFFKRVYEVLEDLKKRYKDKTILVVAHGGVHHALYAYAHNLPLKGNVRISRVKNCEYRIYELT